MRKIQCFWFHPCWQYKEYPHIFSCFSLFLCWEWFKIPIFSQEKSGWFLTYLSSLHNPFRKENTLKKNPKTNFLVFFSLAKLLLFFATTNLPTSNVQPSEMVEGDWLPKSQGADSPLLEYTRTLQGWLGSSDGKGAIGVPTIPNHNTEGSN